MSYSNIRVNTIRKDKKAKKGSKFGLITVIAVVAVLSWFLLKNKDHAAFSPISVVANVTGMDIKQDDGRTNVLLLGSDQRTAGPVTSILTDTIVVASIGRVDKDVVLISVPRDLWVTDSQNHQMKINSIYTIDGTNYTTGEIDKKKGAEEVSKVVESVLGIPIHYYVVVNFKIFKDTIDLLGGINVNVDTAFTDYEYPVEGHENDLCGRSQEDVDKDIADGKPLSTVVPCRYMTVSFAAGPQIMDSNKALAFSRSRHSNNGEGTDFARAHRQQKVIMAIKDKALSLQTVVNPQKLKDLYGVYSNNVATNIDLTTLQNFYLMSQQIDFSKVTSVVLDNSDASDSGGLLYSPQDRALYGGAYVLIPKIGDYSQIHAYVQKYLFGEK